VVTVRPSLAKYPWIFVISLLLFRTAHRRDTRIIGGFPDAKLTAAVREHWDFP
jgi:hypothetical protein